MSEIERAKQIFRDKAKEADGRMAGCTSYLQRTLGCGYVHALRLMEQLETEEFITVPDFLGKRRLCTP